MLARLVQRSAAGAGRHFRTCAVPLAEPQSDDEKSPAGFLKKFKPNVSSTLAMPHFPSDFVKKEEEPEAGGVPEKLTLNFYLPHEQTLKQAKVDLVLLPALTGDFGVMPGHVPTIAQLRPGVVTVHSTLDKEVSKYFVSSGFAFVHANSVTDLCAVEAVSLDDLDAEAVRAGLQEYQAKLATVSAKGDDYESAAAQIGVEVYSAMQAALGG